MDSRIMSDRTRKRLVAKSVFDNINTAAIARALDTVQASVEVHPIDDLSVHVRVRTQDSGVHYYLVKVSEQI